MHYFTPPSPTVTALSKEISLDYGRTGTIVKQRPPPLLGA